MEDKKEIFKGSINTDIYDIDLKNKVYDLIKNANLNFHTEIYYKLKIKFDVKAYEDERLNSIEIEEDKKSSDEYKDRVYKLLNNQLSNISSILKEDKTIPIDSINIIGDELKNINVIEVVVEENEKKEYQKNGKLKEHYSVNTIMPNEPYLKEELEKAIVEMILNEWRKR